MPIGDALLERALVEAHRELDCHPLRLVRLELGSKGIRVDPSRRCERQDSRNDGSVRHAQYPK